MKLLIGIGNELKGDDAIGVFVAENFRAEEWKCINAGTVPENFLGVVRREKPELLVLVDAAEMSLPPGSVRIIPRERANSMFYSTHSLPLGEFIERAEGHSESILLIGVQPFRAGLDEKMSPEVKAAAEKLMQLLRREEFYELEELAKESNKYKNIL